jgi:3-hydroxyisobutyrate dehydrogenase-like beta-hydroxyacid dehydrogenase
VVDGLDGSPIVSAWQAAKLQRIATGEFSAQFALSLALKDVHLRWERLARTGSRFLPASLTSGSRSLTTDLVPRT